MSWTSKGNLSIFRKSGQLYSAFDPQRLFEPCARVMVLHARNLNFTINFVEEEQLDCYAYQNSGPPGSPDAAVRLRTAKYPSVRYSSCFDLLWFKGHQGAQHTFP